MSTEDQELRIQTDALERHGCWNIWSEKRSATKGPRPELEKALADLRPGDTLVVWKLDRLIRNARDAYKVLDRIEASGAGFYSITEPHLEVRSPLGRFLTGLTALLAQLEVDRTSERTSAGIAAIQERGLRYGAKPKLSEARAALLVKLFKAGETKAVLSKQFRISTTSVSNYLSRARAKGRRK